MTKKEIIEEVANITNISIVDATQIVEVFLHSVKKNVMKGRNIYIRGFGTFSLKKKAARKGRNIKKGTFIDIPERREPVFKISKNFSELL